jgi:hypothetical protein
MRKFQFRQDEGQQPDSMGTCPAGEAWGQIGKSSFARPTVKGVCPYEFPILTAKLAAE